MPFSMAFFFASKFQKSLYIQKRSGKIAENFSTGITGHDAAFFVTDIFPSEDIAADVVKNFH